MNKALFRVALLLGVVPAWQAVAADPPAGVEVKPYTGWDDCLFLAAPRKKLQMVVAPVVGGRIVQLSLNGDNILFENSAALGKTLATASNALWVSGYQCDTGPESRDYPGHTQLWVGPNTWQPVAEYQIKLASAAKAIAGLQIEKEIALAPDTGEIGLTQRLRNVGARDQAFCLWDRTQCKNGGFAMFPLNKKSAFKAGWSIRVKPEGQTEYSYNTENPDSPQVRILDGVLVAQAKGVATKIGADSDAGWIAYARGKTLFVKYFQYDPKGNYSDGMNSVELYWDQRIAELEPLSPEKNLAPGQNFTFAEMWQLIPLDREVTTAEQARKLVQRIKPSPFLGRK